MYTLIVVDYNQILKTIQYVTECKSKLGEVGSSHVVIIENGSPNDALTLLEKNFGKAMIQTDITPNLFIYKKDQQTIVYCNSGENLGYAKGNNLGIHISEELWNDEFYVISNNDLVFERSINFDVVGGIFRNDPQVALIGPRIITPQGEIQSPCNRQNAFVRLIFRYWLSISGKFIGKKTQQHLIDKYVDGVIAEADSGFYPLISGCFFFARAEAMRRINYFDENTFLFAEEMILAKRLEAVDYRIYFSNEIEVVHKHGETTKKNMDSIRTLEIDFESNCYFYSKYLNVSKAFISLAKVSFYLFKKALRVLQYINRRKLNTNSIDA